MKSYQDDYRRIPIPEELDATLSKALFRGRCRRWTRRISSGLAAGLAVVLLISYVPALSAGAAELPVLGQLVRMMRGGSGGGLRAAEDGVTVTAAAGENQASLRFTFARTDGTPADLPPYSIARRVSDYWVLRLHNLTRSQPEVLAEGLAALSGVAEVWPMATTESDEVGLVLRLKPGFDCTVSQYGSPASLLLTLTPTSDPIPPRNEYALCSPPMDFGPELARLTEQLQWEGAFQRRRSDGRYQVVLGSFPTLERAEQAGVSPDFAGVFSPERLEPVSPTHPE